MRRTITIERERARERPLRSFLTIAFVAGQPRRMPLRLDMSAARRVSIGRGDKQRQHRDGQTLRIELDDRTMSELHLVCERTDNGWLVIDQRSKNGTFVDGLRTDRSLLADGAVISMGETFAVYRSTDVDAAVLDGTSLAALPVALRTMHPELESQLRCVRRAAASMVPVLVLGETGTGKELIARAIHAESQRTGELVAINCGAIPDSLMASELFGVRRGAFSGAGTDRIGWIRSAHGGTLLLDEIGEMSAASQVALLRVLQERVVTPVGDTTPVPVDVRVLAATHRDLQQMVSEGRFRDDLLARLAGLVVTVPPLRCRREDIGLIVADALADSDVTFTTDAAQLLFSRAWRRNIRELRQALAAAIAAGATRIERAHLVGLGDEPATHRPSSRIDAARLAALLEAHDDNVSAVARELSTSRTQIARLIQRYELRRR